MSLRISNRYTLAEKACRALVLLLLALTAFSCSGCVIVPMRVPEHTKDIAGGTQKLDFSFIKVGETSRQEVEKNLYAIDTHAAPAGAFWGRWESSKVAIGGMAATPYGPNVGGGRIWGPMNLLVSFDDKGVVTRWRIVKDKKVNEQLELLDAVAHLPFDLSSDIRSRVLLPTCCDKPNPVEDLVLSKEFFECRGIKTPRSNILQITPAGEATPGPDASHIWVTVHFGSRTAGKTGVRSLTLGVEPATYLLLERYQSRPSNSGLSGL